MNKKELIKNLTSDIQDIYSIANRFENSENIHPLDIDLALSKVRNLYELLLKLDSRSSYIIGNQAKEISTTVKQSEPKVEPKEEKDEKKKKSMAQQVTDLALLAQGMLKGQHLTEFIKRSVTIIE